MEQKKLYRSCKNKMLGGVSGGLGEYFEIDPNIVRLIFLLLLFAGGASILLYIIAWVIIPIDPACSTKSDPKKEIKEAAHKISSQVEKTVKERPADSRQVFGLILLIIGVVFLSKNILGINFWTNFWPVAFIVIGIAIIAGSFGKKESK